MSDGKTDENKGRQKPDEAQVAVDDAGAPEEEENSLDFSQEGTSDQVSAPEPAGEYDPRPQEDNARRRIAYLLIGLLWLLVAAIFILLAFKSIKIADIQEFAVLLGPVVTLVSAATGFYYGTKSS